MSDEAKAILSLAKSKADVATVLLAGSAGYFGDAAYNFLPYATTTPAAAGVLSAVTIFGLKRLVESIRDTRRKRLRSKARIAATPENEVAREKALDRLRSAFMIIKEEDRSLGRALRAANMGYVPFIDDFARAARRVLSELDLLTLVFQ
jgi:hypothetical protein